MFERGYVASPLCRPSLASIITGRYPFNHGVTGNDVDGKNNRATGQKKPFLLWYAPFLPHTPHDPPKRLLEKYTQPGRAADVAKYFAMCEWFDETCGELLGNLDHRGLSENTLVIYLSDNGWAATSANAADPNQKLWQGYALRTKSSPYEMGIRTPIMLSFPTLRATAAPPSKNAFKPSAVFDVEGLRWASWDRFVIGECHRAGRE